MTLQCSIRCGPCGIQHSPDHCLICLSTHVHILLQYIHTVLYKWFRTAKNDMHKNIGSTVHKPTASSTAMSMQRETWAPSRLVWTLVKFLFEPNRLSFPNRKSQSPSSPCAFFEAFSFSSVNDSGNCSGGGDSGACGRMAADWPRESLATNYLCIWSHKSTSWDVHLSSSFWFTLSSSNFSQICLQRRTLYFSKHQSH